MLYGFTYFISVSPPDPKRAGNLSRPLPEVPGTPSSPPASTLHPLHPHQNPSFQEEGDEKASAGSGDLLGLGSHSQSAPPPPSNGNSAENSGKDFFSQLNWQGNQESAKSAGYVPFEDKIPADLESGSSSGSESGGSGSSSSGDSSDEFNEFQAGRSPIRFSATAAANQNAPGSSSSRPHQRESETGLLIGNLGAGSGNSVGGSNGVPASGSSASEKLTQQTPQIKLIEFGGSESSEQAPPPPSSSSSSFAIMDPFQTSTTATTSSSTSAGGMDIFQDTPSSTSGSSNKAPSSSNFERVGFDPFSAFISADTANSSQSADSALDDLFGFGGSSARNSTTGFSQSAGSVSGISGGGATNFFDPFGSLAGGQSTTTTAGPNAGTSSSGASLFGGPSLMPTPSAQQPPLSSSTSSSPANEPHATNLLGEPFSSPATVLTPSTLQSENVASRKMSSPDPFHAQKRPFIPTNNLSTSFSSNVSFSHPNLAAFGGTKPSGNRQHGGWGYGMGSVSHNTSPRRSPSPVALQSSSSMENIHQQQQQQQQTQFDPFGQFNLQKMSGVGANAAKPTSSGNRPASASTTTTKPPPTGNSYQPYYMQNQAGSKNGMNHQSSSGSSSAAQKQGLVGGAGGGMGPKVKSQPIFQGRPQSPNYNPSLFSTVGNKTGMYI